MPLSDRQIKGLKPSEKPFKSADGGGLHVYVTPKGSKLFRLAYRFEGKEKLLSFGSYPVTTLSEARAKRDAAKALLKAGLDPSHHIKLEKLARADANANTFDAIADELLAKAELRLGDRHAGDSLRKDGGGRDDGYRKTHRHAVDEAEP